MMRLWISAAICLTVSSFATAQNVLNNFSFESPTGQNFGMTSATVATGFNTSTTWRITSNSVDLVPVGTGGYWSAPAANGSQVLDLSGSSRGTIQQTVTIPTGKTTADLSFNFSRNVDYNTVGTDHAANTFTGQVRILVGATVLYSQQFTRDALTDGASKTNFNWSNFSQSNIPLTGLPSSATIEFSDLTTNSISLSQGIVIDNVSFIPTPEPMTGIVAAVAGVGLYGFRRFRKMRV